MIRRPPRSTLSSSSAASDVYKRQVRGSAMAGECPVAGVCVAFLDRDGTINVKKPEGQYVLAPQEVNLVPGAGRAVRELNDAGWRVIVVTNQRTLARELMSCGDRARVYARLYALL